MIVSASRRTDLPAFYADWLMERLRAGYALTRNPHNPRQVTRVELSPDIVDCLVFWSKDPRPLLGRLSELDRMGYRYYFQFTLTPYGPDLEPHLPLKGELVRAMRELAGRLGKGRVVWRYDPIVLYGGMGVEDHIQAFGALCRALKDAADHVVISFVDRYAKQKTAIRAITEEEMTVLGRNMAELAGKWGLSVRTCCEAVDLSAYGVQKGACIDRGMIERMCGGRLRTKGDPNQRGGCGCLASVDLGAYNTCPHGCVYCYANVSPAVIRANYAKHDPFGEFLLGQSQPQDRVSQRKFASELDKQTRL